MFALSGATQVCAKAFTSLALASGGLMCVCDGLWRIVFERVCRVMFVFDYSVVFVCV